MIRVAGYCRVSTDQADQTNSLESQRRYFSDYIRRQSDWELHRIYADEGITGTSTRKRAEFSRMIRDAKAGKFQLIITKEVSRFSRNILDTIGYTRELKAIGVGVLFMTDGICTLDPDAELRLSIMASIAQEESRKTSARVKWGQTRQMERGVVFGHALLGYGLKNGVLSVKPDEAALVRRIFRLYGEERRSTGEIAAILTAEGKKKPNCSDNWSSRHILKILKNEKYAGDLIQKKSFTPDYLNHDKRINRGEEEKIVLKDHHEAIIDRRLWASVQEEIKRRNTHRGKKITASCRHPFSGKICCGDCGSAFVCRQRRRGDGSYIRRWSCSKVVRCGAQQEKGGCAIGRLVRDDDAHAMLQQSLSTLSFDRMAMAEDVAKIALKAIITGQESTRKTEDKLQKQKTLLLAKTDAALDSYFSGEIAKEELQRMKQHYETEIKDIEKRLNTVKQSSHTDVDTKMIFDDIRQKTRELLDGTEKNDMFARHLLSSVTVFRDRHMELTFRELDQVFYFQ